MNLNEYGIFEYSKNGYSLDTLLLSHLTTAIALNLKKGRKKC